MSSCNAFKEFDTPIRNGRTLGDSGVCRSSAGVQQFTQAQWESCPIGMLPGSRNALVLDLPEVSDRPPLCSVAVQDASQAVEVAELSDHVVEEDSDSANCEDSQWTMRLAVSDSILLRDATSGETTLAS